MWRSGEKSGKLAWEQAGWWTCGIAALCPQQPNTAVRTGHTLGFTDTWLLFPIHTHTNLALLTWPAPHCKGTWVTLVPGCRPDPWRQTAALCPRRSPGIWLCSLAQNHTQDCTRNLRRADMTNVSVLWPNGWLRGLNVSFLDQVKFMQPFLLSHFVDLAHQSLRQMGQGCVYVQRSGTPHSAGVLLSSVADLHLIVWPCSKTQSFPAFIASELLVLYTSPS